MDVKKTINELSTLEKKVLLTLQQLQGKSTPQEIQKKGQFNQEVEVMNAASWLKAKKLINIEEQITTFYSLGKEGQTYLKKGLPEKRALHLLTKNNGQIPFKDLTKILDPTEIPIAVGWMKKNQWITITKEKETILKITDQGQKASQTTISDEELLQKIATNKNLEIDPNQIQPLLSRKNVIKTKEVITSTISLTENGKKVLQHGFKITEEISQITSTLIKTQDWKHKTIRPYDITAFAPAQYGGKPHPLVNLIGTIRQIFLEMGFKEIQGDFVESCFWNMDVLFIPQDHPAREMHDTLYCKQPERIKIDDQKLLNIVAQVHENGGTTHSTGWGYKFSKPEGERALLRTHTTVNTIRYLYHNPKPPCKVFSIGRVFRKENIDATHLPEFYQIEGIVHEENTTFRQLIGVLKEFYKRMGFEKIRFRPGYFPYTEPSMEVEVFWNGEWMELGGSGIFRPEVTEPVGVKNPVLAWGLGLERLAMLKFNLTDMRSLYISDLDWIWKKPLIEK